MISLWFCVFQPCFHSQWSCMVHLKLGKARLPPSPLSPLFPFLKRDGPGFKSWFLALIVCMCHMNAKQPLQCILVMCLGRQRQAVRSPWPPIIPMARCGLIWTCFIYEPALG